MLSAIALDRLAGQINLKNFAYGQYTNYNFDSFCVFNGNILGANEDGLYELNNSDYDGGANISAYFKLPTHSLWLSSQKRLRRGWVGYEADGTLEITLENDEGNQRSYTFSNIKSTQHGREFALGRNGVGGNWTIKIANQNGCDFSVDYLDTELVNLGRKPRSS